jgi:FtsP/CotA-like multicopper oxidase with cupredoxin domain
MGRSSVAVLAFVFVLQGCSGSSVSLGLAPKPATDSSDPPEPPLVKSVSGVAQLDLVAAIDPATNAPGFEYAGRFVAPTIEVNPGDTIDITYKNELPASTTPSNMTNLHFHGITTSPLAPADDVISMMAMPGQQLHYVVPIPLEEEPGIYWYHTHPHGQSNWQVTSGMAGAIVVDGIETHFPFLASLRQQVIVLRNPQDKPDYSTVGDARARAPQTRRAGARDQDSTSYDPCGPSDGTHVTINGIREARIGIQSGERQLFRVVNASANRYVDLAVDGQRLTLVSQDGFPLDTYPGASGTAVVRDVLIPPAGRAEFVVTGTAAGTLLRSKCVDTGPDGQPVPDVVLARLSPQGAAGPLSSSSLGRLPALRPAANKPPVPLLARALPAPSAQHTLVFTEETATNQYFINGAQYDPNAAPAITSRAGTTEEWTVVNATSELHAFHIHQVHFSVESVNGVAQSPGRWVDTVSVPYAKTGANGIPQPGVVKLLMDFRNPIVRGIFVYHCHLLEHEDGGMMAKIEVR